MRGGGIGGFLPISIYFIRGSLVLLVLQCSTCILQLYLHTKGDNSLKIPLFRCRSVTEFEIDISLKWDNHGNGCTNWR